MGFSPHTSTFSGTEFLNFSCETHVVIKSLGMGLVHRVPACTKLANTDIIFLVGMFSQHFIYSDTEALRIHQLRLIHNIVTQTQQLIHIPQGGLM